ncbi:MAG: SDR family NAD(P)-dependent oxidoreductase, partial [Pseudorhodoplanes sp.]|nr:SDR family NAD(P)-dependent oxidoreductase [Pseudorhodoplanes sp.]
MRLKDKIAVISGSGRGIGRAVALAYAREGASIVISDIVEHPEVSSTLSSIEAMGRQALFVKCDVADEGQVATLMEKTLKAFGGIDILVNGAGASAPAMLTEMTLEKWLLVVNSHLTGAFLCTREA